MYLSFTPCNELKHCLKSLDHKNFRDLLAARLVPAALLRGVPATDGLVKR